MLLKFLKIFFSVLALMLFIFLINVTFYFSNYSKNIDFISNVALKGNDNIYKLNDIENAFEIVNDFSWTVLTWTFVKNINSIDRLYFSNINSYEIKYYSWIYEINLNKGLYFLDLNDLSVKYKIKGLWFEISPKSAWMIFLDTTNPEKTLIFSINSIFKFIFKSETWRKVNYYYMYPHNYLIFNVKNNKFSRIWGDVFRIKTVVKDGFLKEELKNNLDLKWFLTGEKLKFFKKIYFFIKKEYNNYNFKFKKLKNLEAFSLIGQNYINKYFDYFINETKRRIYYKQSILNSIQKLYNQKVTSTQVSKDIIDKLEKLKEYNIWDYNDVLSILNWYYKIILKNNSLEDKVILDNFLPLIKYLKLVDSGKIINLDDLVLKIENNQNKIFSTDKTSEIYDLSKQNLDYLYLLRNIDKKMFNKIVLNLELKYKQFEKDNISKNKKILLDKYYYGVLNLKKWNDDLELYVLLKNIFFTYDFRKYNFNLEKYFNNFVNIYFSKLKVVNWEIIIGQHIDIVLLKSFLYYLEDYLNNFAFDINVKNSTNKKNTQNLTYNINILEKYLLLNKYIYFNNSSTELLQTWVFKNKYLLNNILNFIRNKLFKEQEENWLLITSKNYNLPKKVIEKFSNIINDFFNLESTNKEKIETNSKFRVLLEDYNRLYIKYDEYFSALLNYEEYKTKYSKLDSQLDNYKIEIKENTLWKDDIIQFLSQFKGANFSNTKIIPTNNPEEFLVKNFEVNGGVISFKINPEKGYIISNIILESDLENKDKFYWSMYSLEREQILLEKNQKYAKKGEEDKYDFSYYFRNKFFNSFSNNNTTLVYDEWNLRKWKQGESENLRVFKRDKLLAKNWEFSKINDVLKLNYNDVKINSLKDIDINNAEVFKKIWDNTYLAKFNSKYFIDKENDKHYFYNPNWIYLNFYSNSWNKSKVMLWWIWIKVDFNINLVDFKNVFNNIFNNLEWLNKLIYYVNYQIKWTGINIEYKKDWYTVLNFEKDWKRFEFYVKNNKIVFIKKSWEVLKTKNIDIFIDLEKLNLKN